MNPRKTAIADTMLHIDFRVWCIINILSQRYVNLPDALNLQTSVLYNGREKGIVISLFSFVGKQINFFIAQQRNSDQLFVETFFSNPDINPPTLDSRTDESYRQNRILFSDIVELDRHVTEKISFYIDIFTKEDSK